MPIPFIFPVKSDSFHDFTGNQKEYFIKKELLNTSAFFTLWASQYHYIGFVVAHSR